MINLSNAKLLESSLKEQLVKKRHEELEFLLKLANADFSRGKLSLEKITLERLRQHPALHLDNRGKSPGMDLEKLMSTLQRHLRSRLKKIIHYFSDMPFDMPLWNVSGTVSFHITAFNGSFKTEFHLQKVKAGNEHKAYKKVIDLMILDIIRDTGIAAWRFGQCSRCDSFYYKTTAKKGMYCSTKCTGAARQQKYMERKRKKEEK